MNTLLKHEHCGHCVAYLESLQALGMTGLCISRDGGIFMRQFDQDNPKCREMRTTGLCRERMQPGVQKLNESRFFKTATWDENGLTMSTEIASFAQEESTLHKYTHR